MSDDARLHVAADTRDRVNDRKRGDETQNDVIERLLSEADTPDTDTDPRETLEEFKEQLDRIEAAASTAESRTGSIESTLEQLGGR